MVGPQEGTNAWGELPGDLGGKEARFALILTVLSTSASKQCRLVATNSLDRGNETSQTEAREIRAH